MLSHLTINPETRDFESLSSIQEYWTDRLENGALPTSEDIHHFLDIIASDARFASVRNDYSKLLAADRILKLLINKLSERLGEYDLRELLNEKPRNQISLIARAAQLCLVDGLECIVMCGASLGDHATAASAYRKVFWRDHTQNQKRIRRLLDMSVCTSTLGETAVHLKYNITDEDMVEMVRDHPIILESMGTELQSWHDRDSERTHKMWIHVLSNNVRITPLIYHNSQLTTAGPRA